VLQGKTWPWLARQLGVSEMSTRDYLDGRILSSERREVYQRALGMDGWRFVVGETDTLIVPKLGTPVQP